MTWLGRGIRSCVPAVAMRSLQESEGVVRRVQEKE